MLLDFKETKKSKIFPNKEFGYYSVTVERPLRLVYENLDEIALPDLKTRAMGNFCSEWLKLGKKLGRSHGWRFCFVLDVGTNESESACVKGEIGASISRQAQ